MKTAVVLLGMLAVAVASIFSPDDIEGIDNMRQMVKQFVNKFVHQHPGYSADSCVGRCGALFDMVIPEMLPIISRMCHSECIRVIKELHAHSTTTTAA